MHLSHYSTGFSSCEKKSVASYVNIYEPPFLYFNPEHMEDFLTFRFEPLSQLLR